jgi:hypothetical protein
MTYLLRSGGTAYLFVRTDFTYYDANKFSDDLGYLANTATWNQYHLQVSANLKKRKFNLRTGLILTYGSANNFEQAVSYDNAHEQNLILGLPHKTKANHILVGLMLSFVHNL